MTTLTPGTIQRSKSYNGSASSRDKGRAADEINSDTYGSFIWSLARRFTDSAEEAEAAVQEMVADIQRCAKDSDFTPSIENRLTARIALRRLMKFVS